MTHASRFPAHFRHRQGLQSPQKLSVDSQDQVPHGDIAAFNTCSAPQPVAARQLPGDTAGGSAEPARHHLRSRNAAEAV